MHRISQRAAQWELGSSAMRGTFLDCWDSAPASTRQSAAGETREELFPPAVDALPAQRYGTTAGSSWSKVRPEVGAPIAVIDQPAPSRLTLAITWALWVPEPVSS